MRWLVPLSLVLVCGCSGSSAPQGPSKPADYCALAALPTRTVSDVEALQRRVKAARAAHNGHGVSDVVNDPGIAEGVLKVEVGIDPALEELRLAAADDSAPATRGPGVARLVAAQDELRVACAAH